MLGHSSRTLECEKGKCCKASLLINLQLFKPKMNFWEEFQVAEKNKSTEHLAGKKKVAFFIVGPWTLLIFFLTDLEWRQACIGHVARWEVVWVKLFEICEQMKGWHVDGFRLMELGLGIRSLWVMKCLSCFEF